MKHRDIALFGRDYRLAGTGRPGWIAGFSSQPGEHPRGRGIASIFEDVADARPEAPALVDAARRLSYRELDGEANQLAATLRERGVRPGDLVGILVERGNDLPLAMLAILKAGGAYVPLDPGQPPGRWSTILEEAKVALLLTHSHLAGRLAAAMPAPPALLELDRERTTIAAAAKTRLGLPIPAAALAYVLFTSGSTGKPKGVLIPQLGVARLALGHPAFPPAGLRIGQLASAGFDAATFEIWSALLRGGTLIAVAREQLQSLDLLAAHCEQEKIELLLPSSPFFHQLVEEKPEILARLEVTLFGADRCEPKLVRRALELKDPQRPSLLVHAYGPTECTTLATLLEVDAVAETATSVPIGFAQAGTELGIFSAAGELVDGEEPGELWIGGDGLADGYLGRPALTAEKFVPHPHSTTPGARLYRSGDWVRRLPSGALDFLGRIDSQIKLRGFRIELGEIENVLARRPEISQVVVILDRPEVGGQRLVAYCVAAPGRELEPLRLRQELARELPEYMVPALIVLLERMPLNANGKIDRGALPRPASQRPERPHRPPATAAEKALGAILAELLRYPELGLDDDLFELSLDSVLILRALARAYAGGWQLEARDFFEKRTLAELAAVARVSAAPAAPTAAADAEAASALAAAAAAGLPEGCEAFPLTPGQQGMLLYQVLNPAAGAYFEQTIAELRGELDPAAFCQAWQNAVDRHPSLRTYFVWERRERPLQVVLPRLELPCELLDWRHKAAAEQERAFAERLEAEQRRGFALDAAPLLRLLLIQLGERHWRLLWSFSHLILDGWSVNQLFGEVLAAYESGRRGEPLATTPAPPFRRYVDHLERQDPAIAAAFFRESLAHFSAPTALPFGQAAGPGGGGRPAPLLATHHLERRLPPYFAELARVCGVTPNIVAHGAWGLLLQELSGDDEVFFGSVVADRPPRVAGVQEMAGLFINALPLALRRLPGDSFRSVLERLQRDFVALTEHAGSAVETIARSLGLPAGTPLFESLLVYQNFPPTPRASELEVELRENIEVTNHPLVLYFHPDGDGCRVQLVYDRARFPAAAVARLLDDYQRLLQQMAATPAADITSFALVTGAESAPILARGRGENPERSASAAPAELPFRAFAARATELADQEALVDAGRGTSLSFGELEAQANRLAHLLIERGVAPGELVAVALERSCALVIALLAIHKAGAAYQPLDPAAPSERLRLLIGDAGARLLLTQEKLASRLASAADSLLLDPLLAEPAAWPFGSYPTAPPPSPVSGQDPAYLIHTSGSTGRPKGVLVEHRQLAFYTRDAVAVYGVRPGERLLQFAALGFDTSAEEIWPALAAGATLVLRSEAMIASPSTFLAELERLRISLLNLPTAYWHELCAELTEASRLPDTVRGVILGGEAASPQRLERWLAHLGERQVALWNTYGPTETTIVATRARLDAWRPEAWGGEVPIGRPLAGVRALVVDRRGRLRPPLLEGELLLGGPGVARGYLGRPAETAARFIPDPFLGDGPGERLYRSGDLVVQLEDGSLLFRGRADAQVKIRGYRVELGEIEAALQRHPQLKDAVVAARELAGELRLVAYWVAREEAAPPRPEELRAFLEAALPAYMVPAFFVGLAALPKTPSGKVDRRALPAPGQEAAAAGRGRPPETPTETLLAALWCELLGLGQVGRDDDFFRLGGHSLLVGRLTSRLRQTLGVELSLTDIFAHSTLAALAARLEAAGAVAASEAAERPRALAIAEGEPRPLSPAQERLYFLYRFDPSSTAYHISGALELEGELDRAALARALAWLETRHSALRTRFVELAGAPYQRIEPARAEVLPPAETLAPAALKARLAAFAEAPFVLDAGPPWRVLLLELAPRRHVFAFAVHHLVFDGLSYLVLESELAAAYAAFRSGAAPALAPLPYSFADFAAWQQQRLTPELLTRQVDYWRSRLTHEPLELPTDFPRPPFQSFRGGFLSRQLPAELVLAVENLAHSTGATAFLGFLAPFLALLARLSGQSAVAVGAPFAGRGTPGSEGQIGFFVNTLVLGARLEAATSGRQLLSALRAELAAAFAHQEVPFEKLVGELVPQRDPSRNPLFEVGFQLLEAGAEPAPWPGLALRRLRADNLAAKFDLDLLLKRAPGGGLEVEALYASDLFAPTTVAAWLDLYELLLRELVAAPERPLAAIELLRPQDRALLAALNDSRTAFPRDSSLPEAFAAAVALAGPEQVAIEFRGATLSYQELDRRSERLAAQLREHGSRPGALVGVAMERGIDLVVALLAIIKTGAAYVPLDADYPADRLAMMVDDSRMPLLLQSEALAAKLPEVACRRLRFDQLAAAAAAPPPLPPGLAFPESLAYVIFTSGSTGRPKGVAIPHRGVLRLVRETRLFRLAPGEVVAQISTASFDAYTIEMWGALLNGGRLLVIDRETQLDPPAFVAAIDREIALLPLNASFFAQLASEYPRAFSRARYLFFGGEASEPNSVRRVLPHKPRHLKNTYGPTECTMLATAFELPDTPEALVELPIGRPISNTEAWVFDRHGRPAPLGVAGELYLGGPGLAHGYWGRGALTAAAFVPHPYSDEPGARLYRTGDLTRILPSGEILYLGRIDSQVKVRGFRIELGEIESVLGRHQEVREKVALTRGKGADQQLLAFVVLRPEATTTATELQRFCAEHLPAYAVPWVQLVAAMPMTPTGKLDRQALLREVRAQVEASAVPLRSASEFQVAAAFGDLLGTENLGAEADFFSLGGHSLLATRLIARLRERCGVELPLRRLFEAPTVAGLAAEVDRARAAAPTVAGRAAGASGPGASGPAQLSFAQQRLFFLHLFDPDAAVYNLPAAYRLRGALDRAALAAALGQIETRQEILRTRFREEQGVGYPELLPAGELELPQEKISPRDLPARLEELSRQSFDLLREKPWRCRLLELNEQEHVLFVAFHHIAFDGLSMAIFENELAEFYEAAIGATAPRLEPLPLSYAQFAAIQREELQGDELDRQLAFWKARLHPEPLELPTDRPRPRVPSFRGRSLRHHLGGELLSRLEAIGRRQGASPFLSLLAPFLMLLARLTGQSVVSVGVPFSGRHRGEVDGLIGFFVNMLVLKGELADDPGLETLLARLRRDFSEVYAHQDVPFEKLAAELEQQRDASRNPLFQVAFQLFEGEGEKIDFAARFGELAVEPIEAELEVAKFDLDLMLERRQGGLEITAWYATDLFDAATVAGWLELYQILLEQVAAAPTRPLSQLPLLRPADRALYAEVNRNATAFPREASLAALFAAQVAAGPERIALECRGETLTYQELDQRTNRLAQVLRRRGAEPGSMVGLCFERGIDLAAAILAVVKTGAAYVPLDGDYPEARLRGMVEDTAMPLLLGSAAQVGRLPALGVPLLAYEALETELAAAPATALPPVPGGLAPAVTIFTSGSTGRPKGVVVTQRAVCRLVIDTNYIEFRPGDVVVQVSTASFDVYTFEIWGAFLHGGRLLVIDRDTLLDPRAFAAALAGREIAALFLTVALFTQMMLEEPTAFSRVRHLMFGGEACEPSVVRRALSYRPAHLQNGYGPAECTTYATTYDVFSLAEEAGSVPIGKPVANTEVLVFDRSGQVASVGVHGELCLAGDGLALGYWRRPALTAQAFVPHPASDTPGARLYRTGDLARLLPSGDFDYLGRIDFQVKVRGYRIELGEIEAVLGRHPAVREKIALTQGKGRDQQLVAFVTVQRQENGAPVVSADELQRFAAETLPAFALPRIFLLEAMPITPNGKIDRRALPVLSAELLLGETPYQPPSSPTEIKVAAAFAALLGGAGEGQAAAGGISREADFFALGGHSLLATRLIALVREACGVEVPVRTLFTASTVAALAAEIDALLAAASARPAPAATAATKSGDAEPVLSFAQQRLLFLHRFEPQSAVYNVPAALRCEGLLDREALARALGRLEERQETLRTRFKEVGGTFVPELLPAGAFTLPREALAAAELPARLAALAAEPFDLLHEKPWRCRLLALLPAAGTGEEDTGEAAATTSHVLFVNVHHIAFDGLSLEIFQRELAACYRAELAGEPADLPALPLSYAAYAAWQRQWLAGEELEKQLAFWRGRLDHPALELPTDRPRPALAIFSGAAVRRRLGAELVEKLESFGRGAGATPFLTFLAPFLVLLGRLSGQRCVGVGVPFSGRHAGAVENLIGFFINSLVVGAELDEKATFASLLPRLREDFAQIYAHQDVPFEKLVEELAPERDPSRNPLFQVAFQLFEESRERIAYPGLTVDLLPLANQGAKLDLDLALERQVDGSLVVEAFFARELWDAATLEGWLELYEILLHELLAAPTRPVLAIDLLRPRDRALLAAARVVSPYPREETVASLFAAVARQWPDQVAIEAGAATLTYCELDQRSNQLARALEQEGIRPGDLVGVCLERGLELPLLLLAIVKAGAAYVPLDADYPAERLEGMVEDCRMPLLLAGPEQNEKLPATLPTRILPLARLAAAAALLPGENLIEQLPFPESAAYVIFTSGSTGRPKGVVIPHRAILRLACDNPYFELHPGDLVAQASTASFDAYTLELWGAWLAGCRLLIVSRETLLAPRRLAELLAARQIDLLLLTATFFAQMVAEEPQAFARVRQLFYGGEACEPGIVRRARELMGGLLRNAYGPTECTCIATTFDVRQLTEPMRTVPIGKPIANTEAVVLDRQLRPVPVGVHGELCLGGDGLAWGYLDRPGQTAAAFVPHPASPEPGARLYRTGDLARMLPTGDFDYLGRLDFQVKVRGFRIELGEIENVLGRHPAVREKVALTSGAGASQQLLAFAVVERDPAGEPLVSAAELQRHCAGSLPAFAVPRVLLVGALPTTPAGKLDRRALLAFSQASIRDEGGEPPRDALERLIAEAWESVLKVSLPSREADFFALGGHSLAAMSILSAQRESLGVELPLALLFTHPVLADYAEACRQLLADSESGRELLAALAELDAMSAEEQAQLAAE